MNPESCFWHKKEEIGLISICRSLCKEHELGEKGSGLRAAAAPLGQEQMGWGLAGVSTAGKIKVASESSNP